ncbi:MAG: hypothetical protein QOF30_2172 [Acidimicrobiaceae bacterium]|nr:hypothetical protein [Acidimicrobiaceae bacterium]
MRGEGGLRSTGTASGTRLVVLALALVAGAVLIPVGAHQAHGSTTVLVALFAAVAGLAWLGRSCRPYGLFSLGGITWATVAVLFVGRWFFPPVSQAFLTPIAVGYYDRNRALIASAVFVVVFALAYSTSRRDRPGRPRDPDADTITTGEAKGPLSTSVSVADLVVASGLLIGIRLMTALAFQVGVPGRQPAGIPLVGVIYYASSYGPLAGAALILWFARDVRSGARLAGALLLCDVLVEAVVGSHGTAFLAILVFGAARATVGRPVRITAARAIPVGLLVSLVIASALLISFVARESLNGGARQKLGDVPSFVATRFGGIEYLAPVIGAVNHTGSSIRYLRTSNWGRYMSGEVYGLPPDAQTGFASTAVGWWYGLGNLRGVAIGSAISGFLAGRFDRWCFRRRRSPSRLSAAAAIGMLLGWATFLLGGTIGSLGGISIGFTAIAMALVYGHNVVSQAASHDDSSVTILP